MNDDPIFTLRRSELREMFAEVLAEHEARKVPAAPVAAEVLPFDVGIMGIGPLILRDWCYATARGVTQRAGFPLPITKATGTQPLRWKRAAVLEWLQQHEGLLPLARGKASNDASRGDALPCA